MTEKRSNRVKILNLRFTESEWKKIHIGFSRSTKQKRSEYLRSILLDKPVTYYTRNQSFDDFLTEMISLRRELISIGNNFNQLVKRLHTISQDPDIKRWAVFNEKSKEILFQKVEEINSKINQVYNSWSQE